MSAYDLTKGPTLKDLQTHAALTAAGFVQTKDALQQRDSRILTLERENADLQRQLAEAKAIIEKHDLCHNLHGKVDARAFADGCAQEQRKHYGCAPDADELAKWKCPDHTPRACCELDQILKARLIRTVRVEQALREAAKQGVSLGPDQLLKLAVELGVPSSQTP